MWLHAQAAGTVARLHVQAGDQVALDALLVELALAEATNDTPNTP